MSYSTDLDKNKLVVFIGHSPSKSAKTNAPFDVSTLSGRRLIKWITLSGIQNKHTVVLINAADKHTAKLANSGVSSVIEKIQKVKNAYDAIEVILISVGKEVSKMIDRAKLAHLSIPHPSGLNRKLNDPKFEPEVVKNIKQYVLNKA